MTGRTSTRVRYPETDRMGVAHHVAFFVWFEMGRTEALRDLGFAYAGLEDQGILLPVVEAGARYLRPARYDEELSVKTTVVSARGARVRFAYEVARSNDGVLLATGFTEHGCVGRDGRPRRLPPALAERLASEGAGKA